MNYPYLISRSTRRFLSKLVLVSVGFVGLTSILDLTEWLTGASLISSFGPYWAFEKPGTALVFLLSAVALALLAMPLARRGEKALTIVLGAFIAFVGLTSIGLYTGTWFWGWRPVIPGSLLLSELVESTTRMAFVTAFGFLLTGAAIILMTLRKRRTDDIAHFMLVLPTIVGYFIPLSYLFGVYHLHTIQSVAVSLDTGIAVCFLYIGLFAIRPETRFMRSFTVNRAGSLMARRMIPVLLLMPIIIGGIQNVGESLEWFSADTGEVIVAMSYTILLIAILWLIAVPVNRKDDERLRNESLLTEAQRMTQAGSWEWIVGSGAIRWSEQMYVIFGEKQGTFIPTFDRFMEHVHPEDRDNLLGDINRCLADHNPFTTEYRILRNATEIRHIVARGEIMLDQVTNQVHMIGTVLDVSGLKQVEENLRLSRERFSTTLASIGDAVIATDVIGNITIVNRTAEELTGWDHSKILGKPITEIFRILPDPSASVANNPVTRVLASGKSVRLTGSSVLVRRDGVELFIESNAAPIFGSDGSINGAVLVFRDVTEQKMAEQKLRFSEQRLRHHFENSPLAVIEWDTNYIVTEWSLEAERLFGWTREEAIGKALSELNMVFEEDYQLVEKTMARLSGGGDRSVVATNRNYTKSGTIIECTWFNSVLVDEKGEMVSVMSLVEDITDQRRAEAATILAKEDWERTFDAIPDMISIIGVDHRIRRANQAMADRLGLTKEECIGTECFRIMHCTDIPPGFCPHSKLVLDGNQYQADFSDHKWGRNFIVSVSPIYDNQGILLGSVHLIHDITERKKAEEALAESEQKFSIMFEAAPVGLSLATYPDGKIHNVNQAWLDMVGIVNREDVIGKSSVELGIIPKKEDRDAIFDEYRSHGFVREREIVYRTVAGEDRVCLVSLDPVELHGTRYLLSTNTDITERKLLEESNRRNEEQFRNLFESLIEGFCVIEMIFDGENRPTDYRFINVNPAFEAQTGLKEVEGRLVSEVIPDNEPLWNEFYGRIALTGKPGKLEREVKALNRWYEVFAYRVGDETSRRVGILFNDITDRKIIISQINFEASRARLLAELSKVYTEKGFKLSALYQKMAENIAGFFGDLCVITIEGKEGGFLVPEAVFHPDPGAQQDLHEILMGMKIKFGEGNVGKVASTGETVMISGKGSADDLAPAYHPYSEKYGVFDRIIVPIPSGGRTIGTIGIMRLTPEASYSQSDRAFLEEIAGRAGLAISNIKLYEELQFSHEILEQTVEERTATLNETIRILSEEQKRFRDVLDKFPSTVALISSDHCFSFVNREFRDRFGDAVDKRCYKFFYNREAPCEICPTFEVNRTGQSVEWEWNAPDGKLYLMNDFPFKDVNGSDLILEIGNDITLVKQAENDRIARQVAEQANRSKSEFLANISHEIRTPMNSIIGFSELLASSVEKEKQRSQVNSIRSSAKTLLVLINDILDLSKIEAGKLQISAEPVDLKRVIGELEVMYQQRAAEKNISFLVETEKGLPDSIVMDEIRIRQVLSNLLDNAVKFTAEGHVILVVDYKSTSRNHIDLYLTVEDTGVGIPPDHLELIFEAFHQHRDFAGHKQTGTGLGLTITRRLVELMGGTISVSSEPGKGSTFSARIPGLPVTQGGISGTKAEEFDITTLGFRESCLLIVDDNAENRKLIADLFDSTPVKVIEASNGRDAITTAQKSKPDLVLMDLRMPVMNGYDAATKIKAGPDTNHIPVIALSASPKVILRRHSQSDIFDGFIMKPVNLAELARFVTRYIGCDPEKYQIEETTAKPPARPAKVSRKTLKLHREMVRILEHEFLPVHKELVRKRLMSQIDRFGKDLIELGSKSGSEMLCGYGREICTKTENFEVDSLLDQISLFPELIETLKETLEN